MRTNIAVKPDPIFTHEGAKAIRIDAIQQLRRSVMACMLWEDSFYESGESIAKRIHEEVAAVLRLPNGADIVGNIAYEARTKFKLRHAPLWLILALVKAGTEKSRAIVAGALQSCIQRPDEIAEFLAMYWSEKKQPIPNQVKRGLAAAFQKFDRWSLSRYANRDGKIKMRDALFLVHAKPKDGEQAQLWKELASNELKAPEDTWEVALSAGKDKKETFSDLLRENKLGSLAVLRNLRNMIESGVDLSLVRQGILQMKTERVLPFRFITAARYAPSLEPELEQAMFKCLGEAEKLKGRTVLVVDNSGSMYGTKVSAKSELDRADAACALAMLLREVCEDCQIVVFGSTAGPIPPRRGFALRDAIKNSGHSGGTDTQNALALASTIGYDRCVVITDEQSHTSVSGPNGKGYFVNVASYKNGIGYGPWLHVDGWSEAIVDYIREHESQ